jgi:hypothetical protein
VVSLLKNPKIIAKVARFFAIISFVFVIFSAIVTFFLIQIASPSAPVEYTVFIILSNIVPYLFIAALSLIIAYVAGSLETEAPEKEAVTPAQAETINS